MFDMIQKLRQTMLWRIVSKKNIKPNRSLDLVNVNIYIHFWNNVRSND